MNYKLVLKTYSQLRQLTDDETALLNTLRSMTDTERELLAETLGPPAKAKAARSATKKFKKCDVCGISKRAAHHRDVNRPDYHEFDEGGPRTAGKSARANGMAAQLNKSLAAQKRIASDTRAPLLCDYEIDGRVCKGAATDAIHDEAMGYGGYHPFQFAAHSAESSSSTGQSAVSSEVETASASGATGG